MMKCQAFFGERMWWIMMTLTADKSSFDFRPCKYIRVHHNRSTKCRSDAQFVTNLIFNFSQVVAIYFECGELYYMGFV